MRVTRRLVALTAGLWAGLLLCIATFVAPAAFSTLARPDAGRLLSRVFELEAYLSIAVSVVLIAIERHGSRDATTAGGSSVFSINLMLLLATLFCTVAGHFAVQPFMQAARMGQGAISFGTLHAIAACFFAVKGLFVLMLAWRLTAAEQSAVNRTATIS